MPVFDLADRFESLRVRALFDPFVASECDIPVEILFKSNALLK